MTPQRLRVRTTADALQSARAPATPHLCTGAGPFHSEPDKSLDIFLIVKTLYPVRRVNAAALPGNPSGRLLRYLYIGKRGARGRG